jgi:hypothetical protein
MNYNDLTQNIITLLNRDDLTDQVYYFAESTIRKYQRDFFYNSPTTELVNTVVGQPTYDLPEDLVNIDYMRLNYSNVWQWMNEVTYESILHMDVNIPSTQSVPTVYAIFDSKFRVYSAPDQVCQLEITGNGKIPIPDDDDVENFWTNAASDLITYATLAQIYAVRIKDTDSAQRCQVVAEQHRLSLARETQERATMRLIRAWW